MASNLRQASSALDSLHSNIQANRTPIDDLSEAEKLESDAAKKEAQETIAIVRRMISQSIAKHESSLKTQKPKKVHSVKLASSPDDKNQQFKLATETNLQNVATTATTMSKSISDIMNNFNGILNLPGLENFSATLESVPAVGVLNGTIQYVGISLSSSGQTNESWTLFDNLPATPTSSEKISLFSYSGAFYAAIGAHVYQKVPKPAGDPTLPTAATDNWANLFYPGWQNMGNCIPAGDSKCIIPYNQAASDGTVQGTSLVRLASDGSLSWASGVVAANMQFSPLLPLSGTAPAAFVKIAYWNNSIWAYDAKYILYELKPTTNASGLTGYNLGSITQLDQPIDDLTAVDTGLVALRQDQNLYKLIISPPKDQSSPPTSSWTKWIAQGGVTNLSAASPGVILDLRTLTVYLKSSYITTQTNLFPYINQIQGFCASHAIYLSNLLTAAQAWQNATTQEEKDAIANGQGHVAVQHAQIMSQLLSTSLTAANQLVVQMARQTSDINSSINTQLANIGTQLKALNDTLNDLESQHAALTAGLWCAIAAVIVGIGLIVAGFFFPPVAPFLWLGGGALIVGGVVAVGVLSSKIGQLNSAIASTQASIANLTTSKNQLLIISQSFGSLTNEYSDLTAFWTQMLSISGSINSLESLGVVILGDQPSIQAAQGFNQQIIDALTNYVQVLGQQGIVPPSLSPPPPQSLHALDAAALVDLVQATEPNKTLQKNHKLNLVSGLMKIATQQLAGRDHTSYVATMRKAIAINAEAHNLVF